MSSGLFSSSELGSIFASLGNPTTNEELQEMINEVDFDGDGFIDLHEFIVLNTKDIDSDGVLEHLKDTFSRAFEGHVFSVFVIDKNEMISAKELQNVLKSLGEESWLAECKKMISEIDSNGNGISRFDAVGSQRQSVE
ncbi:unnamed protein product [Ilex paraguariensis]|uniref:EF-hand domain-containing protein n=1 Tax=Ilex paraguariensis TaxID=185542 RepID=A0ABC8SEL4_9AQUA